MSAIRTWAEQQITDRVDPEHGTGWQLAAAPLSDGGTIVSLVCSHMVADGSGMVAAVRQANREDVGVTAADLGPQPTVLNALVEDIGDTVGQITPIVQWVAKKAAGALSRSAAPESPRTPAAQPHRSDVDTRAVDIRARNGDSRRWSPPYVVVELPAEQWRATAAEWGGTSNSLFIALMTAISEASGRARPGDELRWSLPYSERDIGDLDSNSTKIIPVCVPVAEPGDRDLSRFRKASKSAFVDFAARQAAGISTESIPLPLIQMLPDAIVAKLPMPADGAEGLCSNLGHLPDDFVTIGGVRARSVAARATFVGADAASARRLGGGSTAWAAETDDAVTITLHGMDPDRMSTDEELRRVVEQVLSRWNLTGRYW
ncbi:hypothetical protein QMK17_17605 [Rhodococcus sp. G-MC3]|uniref:hypothetical protein n=1 Tax=Rhodococcus sp. G-MC3 TaxID=3046209 RepID=UPI0024BA1D5D|nr:hypothetical protein [Rhodococcus sp. G-MC3]MDJ0395144.1 hypothetical protein [Rhodococcus sp. G-MC3]